MYRTTVDMTDNTYFDDFNPEHQTGLTFCQDSYIRQTDAKIFSKTLLFSRNTCFKKVFKGMFSLFMFAVSFK